MGSGNATSQSINVRWPEKSPWFWHIFVTVFICFCPFRYCTPTWLPSWGCLYSSFRLRQVSFKVAALGESLIKFSQNCLPCNNKVAKFQNYCKFLGSLLICLTNSAVTVRSFTEPPAKSRGGIPKKGIWLGLKPANRITTIKIRKQRAGTFCAI